MRKAVNCCMTVIETKQPLEWGNLDLPLLGIDRDLEGKPVSPVPTYVLAMDAARLWFVAGHRQAASLHPQARPGVFQAELWKYDTAELFIADPSTGRYLEINMAPNGAWWTCEFIAPRVRADEVDIAMPEVATYADLAPDGSWIAAMAIPLDLLRARLNFGQSTTANVTMILNSPTQQFLSAADLKGVVDFHQPQHFPQIEVKRIDS